MSGGPNNTEDIINAGLANIPLTPPKYPSPSIAAYAKAHPVATAAIAHAAAAAAHYEHPTDPNYISGGTVESKLIELLPDIMLGANCPEKGCTYGFDSGNQMPILKMVQHINDTHGWAREDIADWLESLDADLTFPTPKETEKENA